MTGIIIDVSVLVVVLLFVVVGYFKGFFRTIVSLFGTVGALVVAYFTKGVLASVMNSWFGWGTAIANVIMGQVANISNDFVALEASTTADLKTIVVESDAGILYKQIFSWVISGELEQPTTVAGYVGNIVGNLALSVISFILVFVLIKLVVFVLNKVLKKIPRDSFVGKANKVLGCIAGALNGLIFIGTVLVIVYFLNLIPSVSSFIYPYLEQTLVTKYLFKLCGMLLL